MKRHFAARPENMQKYYDRHPCGRRELAAASIVIILMADCESLKRFGKNFYQILTRRAIVKTAFLLN